MATVAGWLRAWVRPVNAPPPSLEEAEQRRRDNHARLETLAAQAAARRRAIEIQQDVIQRRGPQT